MRAAFRMTMVAALCTAVLAAQKPTPAAKWEQEWTAFGPFVSPFLVKVKFYPPQTGSGYSGPLPEEFKELTDLIDGHTVSWVGAVKDIKVEDGIASMTMSMPPLTITVQPGHTAVLQIIALRSTKEEATSWQPVKPGDRVRFKTTLKSNSILPAVGFMVGLGRYAGDWSVGVATSGALAVEVLKEGPHVSNEADTTPRSSWKLPQAPKLTAGLREERL